MHNLDGYLVQFEEAVVSAPAGIVHWARDAAEANAIVLDVARQHGATEAVKVKSLTTDEIELNDALAAGGVHAIETDFAELILQLDGDWSVAHPRAGDPPQPRGDPRSVPRTIARATELVRRTARARRGGARLPAREVPDARRWRVSGANFGVAETGTVCVVESEGNGRMCTTLPPVLDDRARDREARAVASGDLEVFLQLLPRSSTGERMNPYTSLWTGVTPGDGPQEFHVVLLDNGRTRVLADEVGRQALHCIRCSACLNVCPVYARTGGHAYGSVYPGPIGAILTPQLRGVENAKSLPYASIAVRRLLRGLPGQDRHPDRPAAPARRGRRPGRPGVGAARRCALLGAGLRQCPSLRAGAATGAGRRPSGRGACPGRSNGGRGRATCRPSQRDLPGMVEP